MAGPSGKELRRQRNGTRKTKDDKKWVFGGKVISCKLLNLLQETSLVTLGIRSNLQICL